MLTVDRLDRLGEVRALARRTRRIAMQSVLAGMGMSVAAMVAAAAGLLPAVLGRPVAGSDRRRGHPQRAAGADPGRPHVRLTAADAALNSRFSREHLAIWADIEQLRTAADALGVCRPRRPWLGSNKRTSSW